MVGSHSSYGLVTRAPFSDPEKLPFAVITLQARRSWNPLNLLRKDSFETSVARQLPA
ncbi:hypothetical protein CCP4SC76_590001 [Gammaproteobacteria bacterium]